MPTIRYEIRNEYGLADPELHRAADEDDPEALLEGVAMAGLVGVLRQLGDLAEFASEIFHDLHEEVTGTAARGHGLMLWAQQLEAEFQSIEKAFLSQTNPSPLAYNEGINWHSNLRMDQNLVTQGDMPRFIRDSYEECRGPPRLFTLDKFDVAGAGACLKRYSDPSFFKVDLASSGMMEEEVREKKSRKIKRKGCRWRNGETTRSFLAPLIRSNLQPEQIFAKVPMRHVRLKSRNLIDSDISNKRSYIEHLLEVNSPEQKVIDQFGLVAEVHQTVTSTAVDSPILKDTNGSQPLAKMEAEIFPKYGLANQKTKVIEMLTPVPDKKIMIKSKAKQTATVYGNSLNEPEKYSPALLEFDHKKSSDETQITTADGFDDHGSPVKNRREAILDGYSSDEMAIYPSYLQGLLDQKNSFSNAVFALEGDFDGYRSDDLGSDLENYVDALTTMESEIVTDSESREKSDAGVFDMEAHRIHGIKQRQHELPGLFSEPDNVDNLSEKGLDNILVSSPSSSETSGNLSDTQHSQEDTHDFSVPVIPEISLNETHVWTSEELQISGKVEESIPSAHLLINNTCNANGSEPMSAKAATVGAFSSSCIPESSSSGGHVFPQTSDEIQSLTMLPEETFPGYVEGNNKVDQHLNGNLEVPSKYVVKSEIFPDNLLNLSDKEGSFFVRGDAPEDTHFIKHGDEASSVSQFPPCETLVGSVGNTHEGSQQLTTKKKVSESADNYDSNRSLPSPEIGSSISASKGSLEEIHPEDCPRKRIPEMSDKINMLDHLSLRKDYSSLDEAPRQFDETALFTRERISDINGEQKRSTEQETEALSGESIFLVIHSLSGNNGSAVVNSDDPAAEMEGIEKPENLPAEVFSNNVRLYHGVVENLPCNVCTSEPLSQDYEGMESLQPAAHSTIPSDDLLPGFVVPERADTEEDTEEHFSKDTSNTKDNSFPEEILTWCVKELITSFTEEDAEAYSDKMLPASNCDLPIETSPTAPHPYGLAAELDNSAAPSEDSIDDDMGETKIIMPNFLPLELEQLSARKEPKKSHEMDSAEILPGVSIHNEFPDGRYLQSTESVCIGGIGLTDNLGFPCVPRTPNLHEDEYIEECDDSLEAYVIVEADADNQGACSVYSPNASVFDVDYLPRTAVLDSQSLETKEMSYLKSTAATPKIDNQEVSSPTDWCSEFPIVDSSYYSDAKLSHGVWKTAASKPNVGKGDSLYLSENEDSFSREGIDFPNQFLVDPAIPLADGKERNVTSSTQEGKHLEVSDIQFETSFSDKQTLSQSNSKVIDDQSLEPEPHAMLTTVEMNELDIHSSSDARYEHWEKEAVSFESPSDMFVGSMMSPIFPIIASYETSPQKCLEPQVLEATPSLQLQNIEGTTPFPPIPIVQEFSEQQVAGAPSNLQKQDVERKLPLLPLPPVEWRKEKLMFGSGTSVGDTSPHQKATNPFGVLSSLDTKHPQGSLADGFEVVQPTASPLWEDDLQGSLYSEGETRSGLPQITDKEGLMHGMKTQNPSRSEYERKSDGPDALMMALVDKKTQHPDPLQGVQSIEDKRPRLGQLLPSLELERSRHEPVSMGDAVLPLNPFLAVSSSEEFKHQYGYGGESLQHLKMSAALPTAGPNFPPYGFLYQIGGDPSMIYDFMVPSMEGERPSRRHRSIRDLPRNPLIEAVVAHDKSTLRKVSELDPPRARPEADERNSLLEQIRNKSFNLKPANAPKLNMKGPPTNLKLAAILEKANAIRQACMGSDEEDDYDGDSWSDS